MQFAAVNNILFFVDDSGQSGHELWRSDGTAAGTFAVKDVNPGAVGSNPEYLTNVGGALYFIANDGVHGRAVEKRRDGGGNDVGA